MKNLCLAFLGLTVFLFASCDRNAKCKLTSEDSMGIYNAVAARAGIPHSLTGTLPFYNPKLPDSIIKEDRARQLHLDYLNGNVLPVKLSNGEYIRYFSVPPDDVKELRDSMKTDRYGLRIYFGYDKITSQYHLIMTGVNDRQENNLKAIFNEFKPCPDICYNNPTDLNYRGPNDYAEGHQ